ncbi:MAG: hypothetical protein M3R24_14245 [Chloroflexota bacterium]|nr:hypothetical protein [Chloroflexota bacterium]
MTTHQPTPSILDDRDRIRQALREDDLLVEPAITIAEGDSSDLTLDEAAELLSRGKGASFSQQVDEERGPRD